MRVLVADEFPKVHLESLRGLGLTVDFRPGLKGDALAEAAKDASILVVRSTEVPAKVFEVAKGLSLVIRAGAGVNTIDVKAASARGVFVANCPGQNAIAVAELTFGLMLAVDRRIPDNVAALRQGSLEQEALLPVARAVRAHAGHRGAGRHWRGGGRAGAGVWNEGGGATRARCHARAGQGAGHRARGEPAGPGAAERRAHACTCRPRRRRRG